MAHEEYFGWFESIKIQDSLVDQRILEFFKKFSDEDFFLVTGFG